LVYDRAARILFAEFARTNFSAKESRDFVLPERIATKVWKIKETGNQSIIQFQLSHIAQASCSPVCAHYLGKTLSRAHRFGF
jgi:hypothetical protein